ncbi:MAG TPA: hypothetical protein DCQ92_09440 [Verrucomicrobia subdivision 3 bacterium]|nr:hypothetical protein [Limisphaerales bacterium]
MTTLFVVPTNKIELFVGLCEIVSGPDKSVARMKLVPVTSGICALQFVSAASTRLVKLHRIVGGVVSRTMTVRVAELAKPLPLVAL